MPEHIVAAMAEKLAQGKAKRGLSHMEIIISSELLIIICNLPYRAQDVCLQCVFCLH